MQSQQGLVIIINFNNTVSLVSKSKISKNRYGEPTYSEDLYDIYCDKKAVRQSEFFQAAANGFKPEIVLEINSFEYENQEFCYFEGQKFRIYRAYPLAKTERMELYLTAIVGETNVTS